MTLPVMAEYIWLDGGIKEFGDDYPHPTQKLRSKTKILNPHFDYFEGDTVRLDLFPDWGYDGSSTGQASGDSSDCVLKPVCAVRDPIRRKGENFLVMCEVFNADGTPHDTNQRHRLAKLLETHAAHKPLIGFEQEFTLFKGGRPLGWPDKGYPPAQGPFYCGVGSDEVAGRNLCEAHLDACLEAGLLIAGFNFEVMLGQAEFQIGYRGFESEEVENLLVACDHLWLARWMLYRLGENMGITATLHPKPIKGDWNGSGMHTNFSTAAMRTDGGMKAIEAACVKIGEKRQAHLDEYGEGYMDRLTGKHETCSHKQFKFGVSDRTASIRIPQPVAEKGQGYLEDRRPNSNADPYRVGAILLETVCV